ncbi:MAG TPA: BON domain-containing protein [Pirellulales bacterium]|nr:BON domain-containing protein [Pirellulales bacterium]
MPVETETIPPPAGMMAPLADHRALALRIKRSVRRSSGGGVRSLDVQVDRESIRLGGRCASFYCKQLAQQAAMRLSGGVQVINGIEVEG